MFLPVDQNIFFLSIVNLRYFRTHNYIIIIQTLHLYLVYSIHYHMHLHCYFVYCQYPNYY